MNPTSSTILLTGGTGFLGAYLLKELIDRGYTVKATRRNTSHLPGFIHPSILARVEWIEADLLDVVAIAEAMQGVDAVIHAAALVSFQKKDEEQLYTINVEGTANMVNMALENDVPRFVYISSVAALGRTKNEETVTEETEWTADGNHTHYALSKFRAEMEVWRAAAEGLNAVILNPSTIIGYGDWNQSSSAIFKNAFNEFPWYTEGINGFVAVEDVAKAAADLLATEISEERFIINAENRSFKSIFDQMADGFGKKRPHKLATPFLAQLAWRLEKLKSFFSGKSALLTKETAKVAQSKTRFDNQKLLNQLPGFEYRDLDSVIRESCEQYLAAINAGK